MLTSLQLKHIHVILKPSWSNCHILQMNLKCVLILSKFHATQLMTLQELSNLTLLKDSLKKSNTNTENMLGILSSFETRLRKLEQTIVPVYKETENLRRRQESILNL